MTSSTSRAATSEGRRVIPSARILVVPFDWAEGQAEQAPLVRQSSRGFAWDQLRRAALLHRSVSAVKRGMVLSLAQLLAVGGGICGLKTSDVRRGE